MALNCIRSICFPYTIEKQKDGSWIFFNREYMPIGFNTSVDNRGSNLPIAHKIKGLGDKTLQKLSYKGTVSDVIYLYKDGCIPTSSPQAMKSYLKKLEILLKLDVKF